MPRGRPRKPKPYVPPEPWQVHALGVEQVRPAYKLIRGADLIRNREAVRKFAYGLEPSDRESFFVAVAEYLGARLEASRKSDSQSSKL